MLYNEKANISMVEFVKNDKHGQINVHLHQPIDDERAILKIDLLKPMTVQALNRLVPYYENIADLSYNKSNLKDILFWLTGYSKSRVSSILSTQFISGRSEYTKADECEVLLCSYDITYVMDNEEARANLKMVENNDEVTLRGDGDTLAIGKPSIRISKYGQIALFGIFKKKHVDDLDIKNISSSVIYPCRNHLLPADDNDGLCQCIDISLGDYEISNNYDLYASMDIKNIPFKLSDFNKEVKYDELVNSFDEEILALSDFWKSSGNITFNYNDSGEVLLRENVASPGYPPYVFRRLDYKVLCLMSGDDYNSVILKFLGNDSSDDFLGKNKIEISRSDLFFNGSMKKFVKMWNKFISLSNSDDNAYSPITLEMFFSMSYKEGGIYNINKPIEIETLNSLANGSIDPIPVRLTQHTFAHMHKVYFYTFQNVEETFNNMKDVKIVTNLSVRSMRSILNKTTDRTAYLGKVDIKFIIEDSGMVSEIFYLTSDIAKKILEYSNNTAGSFRSAFLINKYKGKNYHKGGRYIGYNTFNGLLNDLKHLPDLNKVKFKVLEETQETLDLLNGSKD